MSNQIRDLLKNWRNYQRITLNENTDSFEKIEQVIPSKENLSDEDIIASEEKLSDEEIQNEKDEFKKSVSGIVELIEIVKTKNDLVFISGYIKISNDTINFTFKFDKCVVSINDLDLTDESIKILIQLKAYHPIWVKKWQEKISLEKNG